MSVAEQLVQESRGGKDSIRLLYFGQKTSLIDAVLKRSDDVITSLRLTDPVTLRRVTMIVEATAESGPDRFTALDGLDSVPATRNPSQ